FPEHRAKPAAPVYRRWAPPICSARRRSCGCADAIARSSSPRPTGREPSRPVRPRRSPRPLRRCGRRALPQWSPSIRRASEYTDRGVSEEHGQVIDEELSAEDEARRRLALAQIRQWPDPVLKLRAEEVEDFDEDLRRLVARMQALMADAHGIGLAGNQAGVL